MPRKSQHTCIREDCIKCLQRKRRVTEYHTNHILYKYVQILLSDREATEINEVAKSLFARIRRERIYFNREVREIEKKHKSEVEMMKWEKEKLVAKILLERKYERNQDVKVLYEEKFIEQENRLGHMNNTINNLREQIYNL